MEKKEAWSEAIKRSRDQNTEIEFQNVSTSFIDPSFLIELRSSIASRHRVKSEEFFSATMTFFICTSNSEGPWKAM